MPDPLDPGSVVELGGLDGDADQIVVERDAPERRARSEEAQTEEDAGRGQHIAAIGGDEAWQMARAAAARQPRGHVDQNQHHNHQRGRAARSVTGAPPAFVIQPLPEDLLVVDD